MCGSRISSEVSSVNPISIIITIGAIIALIVFGYTLGYQIGSSLGQDITNTVIENGRLLDN